ncbi:MAG TPA: IS21 family transposase [Terriglobia bacterium]|nr:IS21 family transposase [Terriglobia bacterium]
MSNVLSDEKQRQVVALGQLGWPLRRIQREIGIRRETAAGYLRAAGVPIRSPGRWGRLPPSDSKPAQEVTTGSEGEEPAKPANEVEVTTGSEPPRPSRSSSASACLPFHELIEAGLGRGRNAIGIWQDLVDQNGFAGAYESVKRYVRKLRGTRVPEPRAVIQTAIGEEAQVDYGTGPMVRDPRSGKYRRTRLFVMTLGYSRKAVRLLVFESSSQIWAQLHEQAFRRLGGSVRVVVLDNLAEGVLRPDIYDPALNPLYRDVLAHYGAVALPCRVGDPDRKGKVESGVGHAKKTPLKGQRFESLEQAQAYLDHWEEKWADLRIHGTTKRQVAAMFAEEKPVLQPLPLEPFRYYQYGERTVHLDGCVEVEAAYYSAPPRWIGRRVQVQWNLQCVRLLDPATGELLREHLREPRGRHRIHDDDRPQRTPLGTLQVLARAEKVGAHIGAFAKALHREQGQTAVRRIQGLLSFSKKYGAARVDQACAMALEMEVYNFGFVRRYLERNLQPALGLRQVDPLIRQLSLYRDLIQEKTDSPHNQETKE